MALRDSITPPQCSLHASWWVGSEYLSAESHFPFPSIGAAPDRFASFPWVCGILRLDTTKPWCSCKISRRVCERLDGFQTTPWAAQSRAACGWADGSVQNTWAPPSQGLELQQGQFSQLFPATPLHSTYLPLSNALDKTSHPEAVPALYAHNVFCSTLGESWVFPSDSG